jgi:hypothetical protein
VALDLAAKAIAEWARTYKIPLVFLNAQDLKDPNVKGVTTHNEVSKAFKQSDHWDPGPGFPMDWVLERARFYK